MRQEGERRERARRRQAQRVSTEETMEEGHSADEQLRDPEKEELPDVVGSSTDRPVRAGGKENSAERAELTLS